MVLFMRRRHPMENVRLKMRDLVVAWDQALRRLRVASGRRHLGIDDLEAPGSNFSLLRTTVFFEVIGWAADGETSYIETKTIFRYFGRFEAELKGAYRRLAKSDRHLADDVLKKVVRAADKLGDAIQSLRKAVASRRIRAVKYHTVFPEEFSKIRQAMVKFNSKAARELKGMDVDRWCESPGVNIEDPRQVDMIAKLILVSREMDQCYELRCRSKALGRPLRLMRRLYDIFPSWDRVIECADRWGSPDKIYVAATKPTWRVVWVFDRETVGW